MLTMYARLRGVPEYRIKDIVTDAINLLNLSKWADSLCGNYRYNLQLAYTCLFSTMFSVLVYLPCFLGLVVLLHSGTV